MDVEDPLLRKIQIHLITKKEFVALTVTMKDPKIKKWDQPQGKLKLKEETFVN